MQESGPVLPRHVWASISKEKSSGCLPSNLASTLSSHLSVPIAEPRLISMPDGIERLDSRRAFIAISPAMREVRRHLEQLAGIDGVVLLLGESGTGKGAAARIIHKLSSRASRKFLKVNCAVMPAELLESDLLGHEAGAFPGATQARAGKFEICSKGTILLDEITEMPLSSQARLLRVLQDGEFSRLGSASSIQADVRIIAASNADVRQALQNGTLRADFYYRLNVFTIHLPPLRERREDLPHLLNHFMNVWAASYGRPRLPITRRILEACASYSWPGNLRELENFVKRYLVLGDESLAMSQFDHRPEATAGPQDGMLHPKAAGKNGSCDLKSLVRGLKRDAEHTAIVQALQQTGGNKQEAASLLRISLRALHYKVRSYGIESIPRGQSCAGMREGPNIRSMPPAAVRPAYPLASAASGGSTGKGSPLCNGNGKLINMEHSVVPPIR